VFVCWNLEICGSAFNVQTWTFDTENLCGGKSIFGTWDLCVRACKIGRDFVLSCGNFGNSLFVMKR